MLAPVSINYTRPAFNNVELIPTRHTSRARTEVHPADYSRERCSGGRALEGMQYTDHQQQMLHRQEPRNLQPPLVARYRSGQSYDSSSSNSEPVRKWSNNIRSGINSKPSSLVKEQLRYPHFSLGQQTGFIGMNIPFHQPTYDQFLAGELSTITDTHDHSEKVGRIELLQRISLWKLRAGISWPQVRNTYAYILRKIEN